MLLDVCSSLFVVRCELLAVCYSLSVIWGSWHCLLFVVWWLLFAVRCEMLVVRCVLRVVCLCLFCGVSSSLFVVLLLFIVCCVLLLIVCVVVC